VVVEKSGIRYTGDCDAGFGKIRFETEGISASSVGKGNIDGCLYKEAMNG